MRQLQRLETPELRAWHWAPQGLETPCRLLLGIHGISRNTREVADTLLPLAKRLGRALLVPEFSAQRYPGYQRLEQSNGFNRADLALNRLLLKLEATLPLSTFDLFGYSGGAQFCHRYALCYPQRVRSMTLASAGWYTFPDPDIRYPRGLADWPATLPKPAEIRQFAAIPTLLLVGDADTERDASLRTGPRIDRQQGPNRLVRAQRWLEAWRCRGIIQHWQLRELAGAGHDFTQCVQRTPMLAQMEDFLRTADHWSR